MMLAGGLDPLYREALARPHAPYLLVQVWLDNELRVPNVVYSDGAVTATLTSRVARSCKLTVPMDDFPWEDDHPYAPVGNEIRAWRGIEFADGHRYRWPVFRGKIQNAKMGDADVQLSCDDYASDVAGATFTQPENSVFGANVVDENQRLISDAIPTARFGPSDVYYLTMPKLTWEHDRAQALDEMATAAGSFWYPLADGEFVLRKIPWTVAGDPVVTLHDKMSGYEFATVDKARPSRSRQDTWNQVTVTGERTDGTAASYATESDLNPASPTYVLGPFGRRNKLVKLNTPASTDAARAAARAYLQRTTALSQVWDYSCVPDASVELGDVQALEVLGRVGVVQVVASFTMPLTAKGLMRVRTRPQVLSVLEPVA